MKFPDVAAATLCHEVCHKWLQAKGICSHIEIENEILTDIASVFLGFGKIMLNGCRTTNVKDRTMKTTFKDTTTIMETTETTETMMAGYLDRDKLALVYCFVCAMRSISSVDIMQGLKPEAANAVQRCNLLLGHHYAPRFHGMEATQEIIAEFTSRIAEAQRTMADLDKHVTYVKKSFCESIDDFLKAGHKKIESLRQKTMKMTQDTSPDPALRFLQTIRTGLSVKRFSSEISSLSQDTVGFIWHAKGIGSQLSKNSNRFPPPSPTMFNIVTCPHDGTILRLPENSGALIVNCPKCKYRFLYSTAIVSFSDPPAPRKPAWVKRILNKLRQKNG